MVRQQRCHRRYSARFQRVTSLRGNPYHARMKPVMQCLAAIATMVCLGSSGIAVAAVFNVTEPWLKPVGAGGSTEAYMQLASSDGTTIVAARSPLAAAMTLVTAKERRPAPFALALPAGAAVSLTAGGTRFALVKVVRPLKLGDRVPVTLVLRNADGSTQEIEVDAEVRRHSPSSDHGVGRHQ